ncbi:MAG: hypothetical protein KDD44_00230 [Bdellovibrionales bacterium]|nr:hypothetical protein [Bdellovibrionales bacterium]
MLLRSVFYSFCSTAALSVLFICPPLAAAQTTVTYSVYYDTNNPGGGFPCSGFQTEAIPGVTVQEGPGVTNGRPDIHVLYNGQIVHTYTKQAQASYQGTFIGCMNHQYQPGAGVYAWPYSDGYWDVHCLPPLGSSRRLAVLGNSYYCLVHE